MSLIIKGMSLPEYCEACPCYDWKEDICRITDSPNDFSDTRIFDCPLVEIPTPHGRLIDADRLFSIVEQMEGLGTLDSENDVALSAVEVLSIIDQSPTVIETEVSE